VLETVSIKTQLTRLIIATVVLASFFAALHGYRNSLEQLDTVFDQELKGMANFVLTLSSQLDRSPTFIESEVVFQVFRHDSLVAASDNAPPTRINGKANAFGEDVFLGNRWRTYAVEQNDLFAVVAQPVNSRSESAEKILLSTVQPIVIVIPFIALLIFYIIHKSLGGLTSLSQQLKNKNSDDLTAVAVASPPEELIPVITRINELLSRVYAAFEREKQVSANAAHELRTPISVLNLTVHNIEQEFLQGNLSRDLIDELKQNTARQAAVIEQMIALYRFTPEQFIRKRRLVNPEAIFQDVISKNFDALELHRQTVSMESDVCDILGDAFALYTLFENIFRNSIKYSGEGSHIQVTIKRGPKALTISVDDSGKSVDEAELKKIFERFYRSENMSPRVKGSGLGLSIAKHIVDLHQGEISCSRSKLGGLRTEMVFTVPHEA